VAEFATRQIHARHGIAFRAVANCAVFDEKLFAFLGIRGGVTVLG
jgi:hypothetical protein